MREHDACSLLFSRVQFGHFRLFKTIWIWMSFPSWPAAWWCTLRTPLVRTVALTMLNTFVGFKIPPKTWKRFALFCVQPFGPIGAYHGIIGTRKPRTIYHSIGFLFQVAKTIQHHSAEVQRIPPVAVPSSTQAILMIGSCYRSSS